ncbi:hypothetical protein [Bythopirellula polymerisocia]|uniref:Uncharacterized protein n=1 Tax=Bythopirellula polymerisocia TaxID=2528003 RepID=A0A5C6D0D4_9BACT|nr:hypothetical protein [Bythopirellula polymerisocia]TWU30362.1 hypothetical protein Pla144_11480 [Bythopirellula polymerisocia]
MIRTFLEYQLQRAYDNSPSLPGWLKLALRLDQRLRQFADDTRQIDHQLRAGALAEREALFPEADQSLQRSHHNLATLPDPKVSRTQVGWLSAAALAATVAIAVFTLRTTERHANAEHARFLSEQLTVVPEEMAMMLTLAVNRSQVELPRYNPLTQLRLPEANLLADISVRTQSHLKQQIDSLVSPWESMGTQLLSEWNEPITPGEPGT